ncbi:16S rRNA (guanine(966)-N(2))-methyltransferase RsmD [Sporolactobacillus sp. CQH2019]|uniref:16S rRNA (guanine(966)-N(2))-methyltransferase RsmD n=1 Tax=Sporolactobacillus sp. CQH2019 TaxID=3023512 RepID=UPI002368348F|nr:16S rRNA (guanine(966)-N(2))-methyltransferase RsmD [Sporolactobacillus sp. CQH2019]MDD9147173.1 16S rRNA (guanine(966)-N(2))-methyltransferase RsmD [Sporolactobacillus sp. CQH2019]
MRVIAGENKGRTLKPVGGRLTRPTTDKVKETIFNMIGPFFTGGRALDLYGGSGALGLEALSRGADVAVFVDKAGPACRVIHENIKNCRYDNRSAVLQLDAARAIERLAGEGKRFDYVFLDPPYAKQHLSKDIARMLETDLLSREAVIVVEHENTVLLPERFEPNLIRWKYRTYQGKTAVSIYIFQPEDRGSESVE